jgi:membrane protein
MLAHTLIDVLKTAASEWLDDKAPRLGAALAYYMIFSVAPIVVIVIGIAGLIFGRDAAQQGIIDEITGLVGAEGGAAVRTMVESASHPASGLVGSLLGAAMLLFGATGLFGQLQDALDTIWEVEPKPGRGVWGVARDRFLSFSMVLGVAFLLLVSLIVSAALSALGGLLGEWHVSVLGQVADAVVSLVVITLLFAMIFRFLPDVRVAWRDVWLGATLTAVLFIAGKFAIGLYLGSTGAASAYGAVGSLAVLLIWLYYSAQIFLFGAELTQVCANQFGSRIVPAHNAVRVTESQRANEGIPHHAGSSAGRPTQRAPQ